MNGVNTMIANKYVRENREKRNILQKEYAEWVLSKPEGVSANQVKEHFGKLDTNSVRMSLQRAPNVYIAYWNRATKGHPQAIFKAVKEGDPVPESAKSIHCFNAVDNRLYDRGHVRQGLTVIRGPWPSNGRAS